MAKNRQKLVLAVGLLKQLAHPVRLSILCNLLHQGEMSVGAIVAAEGGAASQSQISQFLARMRADKLVAARKEAQTVYYKIASPQARAVVMALYQLYCGPQKCGTSKDMKDPKTAEILLKKSCKAKI